jgi:undecaprenyl-diphosphatase
MIQSLLHAVALGLVQAVTEFLPVSSSGHLVLFKSLLGTEEVGITIEVMTHFATAMAVIVYLRGRIAGILRSVYRTLRFRKGGVSESEAADSIMFLMIVVGSLPAAVVGLLLRELIGGLFENVELTLAMLMVTGCFILIAGKIRRPGRSMTFRDAIFVGLAQALAIIPGISRSGFTVGAGLMLGLSRREAFEFSLLLSLPAIVGAAALEAIGGRMGGSPLVFLVAAVVAFVGGYIAISLLFRAIVSNRFHIFGYYLIPLGLALLLLGSSL